MAATARTQPRQARSKPRRRMRGALATIGALLIASAFIRLGTGAGQAFATESLADAPLRIDTPTPPPLDALPPRRVSEEDLAQVLKALDGREARIRAREEGIEIRMQALSVAEQEIERKLVALQRAEETLNETLALAQSAAEDDITRLTEVYANMKPKKAAALFEEMDPEFSAGFLARMRPDSAAAIMAGLSPPVAYTISVVLAGRNADVPKE